MQSSEVYMIILLAALAVIATLFLLSRQFQSSGKPTPLVGSAFALVIAGIFLGEQRWIGYSLIGLGVVLSIMDRIINKIHSNN